MFNKTMIRDNQGGITTTMALGITAAFIILLVFLNIADYSLYSIKRYYIDRGIDYSVCAAVQEIDLDESSIGLSEGYDETTGKVLTNNIAIDEESADNAFFSTFQSNTGINRDAVENSTLIVIVNPAGNSLNYIIRKGDMRDEGSITNPADLEGVINASINRYFGSPDPDSDKQVIYVNGNIRTNTFKKRPYFMVFIRDYQINGLFKKRTATFVGFSGAKIERKRE